MTSNFPALVKTGQEPEHKVNPFLKISSIGTETKKGSNVMPDGSALLTNTGNNSNLKSQGINHIIHAVPKMRSSCNSDEEFIEIAVKAAQNSIILADREGIKELAICLIGGEIYRGSCDPQKLAEGIIRGVANQLEKCQNLNTINLIDWEGGSQHHFLKKILELENELFIQTCYFEEDKHFIGGLKNDKSKGIDVRVGDICSKKLHKAEVIVNSENAQMSWGDGISGAIEGALGTEASNVDQQRKDLMKEFNDIINGKRQGDNNNQEKISFLFRYAGRGGSISRQGSHYSMFFSADATPENGGKGKYTIEISENHPIFVNSSRQFWKIPANQNEYPLVKITWYKSEENKKWFENEDFIEIEEQQPQKDNGNDNGDQTSNQNNDNQNQPTKNDNDQSPNEQNEDNNQNGDEKQKPSNGNGSNGNNSNRNKNKNSSNLNIPNSVKEYFRKNKVKSVELDGENWIITYQDKKEKKTIPVVDVQDLQGLESYLQSQGINSISEKN